MIDVPKGRVGRSRGIASRTAIAFLVLAGTVPAQGPATRSFNPDTSYAAENLLRKAADQARQEQWGEALDLYQKVIAQPGDAMARVPKGDPMADPTEQFGLFVDARQHAQTRIAAMPAAARALYRSRVDAQAERWFRQGVADRDRASLRRVLDQAFCSSWGDDALDRLGDMAFQEGQFAEALGLYRRLQPEAGTSSPGLAHPDVQLDPARVAAKKLLCRAAIGTDPPSPEDLKDFAAAYPDAKGGLAGRNGALAESLASALASDGLAIPSTSDGRWPTFAGAPSRSKVLPGAIDVGQFQWRRSLDAPPPPRANPPVTRLGFAPISQAPSSPEAQLAFHPIVIGDQVVVCDDGKIQAFRLNARDSADGGPGAGEEVFAWDQKLRSPYSPPAARTTTTGSPRYTLTAVGDRIYARLGGPGGGAGGSTIVAVRNNRDVEGKRIWDKPAADIPLPRARPDAPNRISNAAYEGTPVADARNVYVALTEAGTEIGLYVACLDGESGAVRWVKSLGTATVADPAQMMNGMGGAAPSAGPGNRLLSLEGQTLYYQTNLGAVAALDAETGAIAWLTTYPTRDRTGVGPNRDSNPAIVHDGLVIVAPDDALPILAFHAASGRLAWKTGAMEKVSHLLGVAKGRLIATGDGVWTWDARDPASPDKARRPTHWPETSLEGYGRGILAGDSIYWPTKTDIYVLDQATGSPGTREPIRLSQHYGTGGGNLAAGDGYLVVAQRDALVVFAQNSRLIDRYRLEIAKAPDRALPYFQLARVAEAAGQDDLALENLEEAIRRARPSDTVDEQPLDEEALAKRFKLLKKLAEKAGREQDWAGEARRFAAAAEAARNDRDRLATRLHLASAQTRAGDPKAAVATLQAVLDDPKLRGQPVTYDERWTVRADLWIADKLAAMLREGGPGLYAEYDRKAEALLARGRRDGSPRDLEEVAHAYPAARVAPEAVLALAELREDEGNPAEAARAYRRLLAIAPADSVQARALLGLARAYEAQGLILPAREALIRAQGRFAETKLDEAGTVGSIVAERLARPPFERLGAGPSDPALPVPLRRVWERSFEAQVRPLLADGVPPSPASPRLFLAEKASLRPIDPLRGEAPWTADLGEEPVWIGYVADRLIAASATRLWALDPTGGEIRWRYPDAEAPAPRAPVNPFAAPAGASRVGGRDEPPSGRLHGFRVAGGRVFVQRGDRQLLALDGDTGGVEWAYAPASGGINPNLWVGSHRVVLQLAGPETVVVLDTDTGRRREFPGEDPAADAAEPRGWQRPPVAVDDDHVAVAVDPRTVALLDLRTGRASWTSRVTSAALPRGGWPRLLGDGSRLLVLFEGNELIRLDPATGRQMWSRALGLEDLSEFPEAFAMDAERFYCATGAALAAYNLSDGTPVWSRPLSGPKTGWSLALADRHVTAYPSPSRSPDGPLDGLSLVVCRRDTGALVQRLSFPSRVSELAVRLLPRGAIVATQRGAWALGEARVVDGPPSPR